MPLISIIIAVYNNERFIKNAIDSVTNQEFGDYEIIIVDDGSTDNTPIIVDQLAENDSRIRVIHQKNQWIYASFNNGAKVAKGDYIYILNSDDKLVDGALKKLSLAIQYYNSPDVIWTKVHICKCDYSQSIKEKIDTNPSIKNDEFYDIDNNAEYLIKLIQAGLMFNQANLYKRELMQKYPFRNDVYGADYLFNLELARHINSCACLKDEIYLFHEYTDCKEMNASVGRYYGYEHKMYNEFYIKIVQLLKDRKIYTEDNIDFAKRFRRENLKDEIRSLLYYDNKHSEEEKLKILNDETWDNVLSECFSINGINGYINVLNVELENYKRQKSLE